MRCNAMIGTDTAGDEKYLFLIVDRYCTPFFGQKHDVQAFARSVF